MTRIITFLKDWILIIAILAGIASYFALAALHPGAATHHFILQAVSVVQPTLIFCMLLLTFCKIDPRHLKLARWHAWLLLLQGGAFVAIGCVLIAMPHSNLRILLEGAMICLICPTATAGAVITRKLGGDVHAITTYTVLINLTAALLIPLLVPFVHPDAHMDALHAGTLILIKVFPLLLAPLGVALLLRAVWPRACAALAARQELSFYMWALALALATAVTARSIVHSTVPVSTQLGLVGISLACCMLQFYLGRRIGGVYADKVTAGQSLGQKNTVLAIWLGYTFFTPVTAVVGGFYSIWHNLVNSYQLYHHKSKS